MTRARRHWIIFTVIISIMSSVRFQLRPRSSLISFENVGWLGSLTQSRVGWTPKPPSDSFHLRPLLHEMGNAHELPWCVSLFDTYPSFLLFCLTTGLATRAPAKENLSWVNPAFRLTSHLHTADLSSFRSSLVSAYVRLNVCTLHVTVPCRLKFRCGDSSLTGLGG